MQELIRLLAGALLATVMAGSSAAPMQAFTFDDPDQEEIFKRLSHEIRCLVCQNQSIGDSNADLAKDLRQQIYEMIQQGKSEDEIIEFLVQRYGDFVLYDPPMKPTTWLLWFGPILMFVLALYFAYRFVSTHRNVESGSMISDEERRRLEELRQQAASSETGGDASAKKQ